MTGAELLGMASRELSPAMKRRLSWAALGALVVVVLLGASHAEGEQNRRLDELEDWKVVVDSTRSEDGAVLDFLGCVQRQEIRGESASACDYDMPARVRARLMPPPVAR